MVHSFMYLIFEAFIIAFTAGIIAAVYRGVLAYEPVLNWWFRWGNNFEDRWFFNPIWGCVKCISGQMGLWAFVFLEIIPAIWSPGGQNGGNTSAATMYSQTGAAWVISLLLAICGAILTAMVLSRLITILKNEP